MKYIDINNAAIAVLKTRGLSMKTGIRLGIDLWRFPIQEDTLAKLEELRHPAESYSDSIVRLDAESPRQ